MDIISIAASIYAGLAKSLIEKTVIRLNAKFRQPEVEDAIERCLHSSLVGMLSAFPDLDKTSVKRLKKVLTDFFNDDLTWNALKELLKGNPIDRDDLTGIYMSHTGEQGNIPGFDFEMALDLFEGAFVEAAAYEPELRDIIKLEKLREQIRLQSEMVGFLNEMAACLKNIDRTTLELKDGVLSGQKDDDNKIINLEIPKFNIKVVLEPKEPIPIIDVTNDYRNKSAKARYLKSLARECLILPLSAMSDESTASDKVTLDQVYIDLDTTIVILVDKDGKPYTRHKVNRPLDELKDKLTEKPIKMLEAAGDHKKLVLLGDPGSGKSTFVKILCALLAQGNTPPGFEAETLPVYIQLRDLAPKVAAVKLDNLPESHRNNKLAAVLHDQIREELERLEAEAFTDPLCDAIREGKCLLVLDGLDEVPFDQRTLIHQAVLAIISKYAPRHIIVTCRIRSYREDENETDTGNHKLPGFEEFTLAKFDSDKITNFVNNWYTAQKDLKLTKEERQTKINRLTEAALSDDLLELSSNPMLLTTMAVIHQRDTELPDKRVQLYKLAVDVLARRWRKHHIGDTLVYSEKLSSFLKDDTRLLPALERLAYEAHTTERINQKSGDLERMKARDILEDDQYLGDPLLAIEFLDYVDQKSGLLTGKGGKLSKPVSYGFPHRTFQEYLAGCHIAGQRSAIWKIMKRAAEGNYWATAVQLGFEELYYTRRNENSLLDIAYRLCPKAEADGIAEERQHLWSSNIAKLLGAEKIKADTIDPAGGTAYLDRLRRSLVQLLSGKLPFEERAEAGRNLAKMGTEQELDALKIHPVFSLRKAATEITEEQAKAMLKKYDFADTSYNKEGNGCVHVYQLQKDGKVVMDYATGLMWQQSGSRQSGNYQQAQTYIRQLNYTKFAGYNDWRLPTLEEAMSLMEQETMKGTYYVGYPFYEIAIVSIYIDPVFDAKLRWIWTADRYSAMIAGHVTFVNGRSGNALMDVEHLSVRAVRSHDSVGTG